MLFIVVKKLKWLKFPASDEWISKVWYTHIVELFNNKKKWSLGVCYNMDEIWKHAKWRNLATKGHITYDSVYMKCPEEVKTIEIGSILVVA